MLCVSIDSCDFEKCLKTVSDFELVELRLDKCSFTDNQLYQLFNKKAEIVATCRPDFYSDFERKKILLKAISYGAKYVDIEVESASDYIHDILQATKLNNCIPIVSYHNYQITSSDDELIKIIKECEKKGASIVKIACFANSSEDVERMLSLYSLDLNSKLISIAMGEIGKYSRISSILLGAPFMYVSSSNNDPTAAGQLDYQTMLNILNQNK